MTIKNIIFDIGRVLVEPRTGYWFITNNFYNIIDKKNINNEQLLKSLQDNIYLHTQEPKNEEEEYKMFSNYYFKVLSDINYPNLTKDIADKIAYDRVYDDKMFAFYADVRENIIRLSKKYNLYIISNGWPSSLRILHNVGLDKYFKGIVISSMYTKEKEESLFDIFLEKYKVNPSESIFVDDWPPILEKAKEYGFNLLLMDRKKQDISSSFKVINELSEII